MTNTKNIVRTLKLACLTALLALSSTAVQAREKEPVDWVNPYIGNISHLLVPTFPTIQLPNSMLRVYPDRADYTSEYVRGLPLIVTTHREKSAFKLMPQMVNNLKTVMRYNYDNEHITPYSFNVELADNQIKARFAVSHQSAIYEIDFPTDKSNSIVLSTQYGKLTCGGGWISGSQVVSGRTKVYIYLESEEKPVKSGNVTATGTIDTSVKQIAGKDKAVALSYSKGVRKVHLRYGVSFISTEQAHKNLQREIKDYNLDNVASVGRKIWNETLGRIQVVGGDDTNKTIFYSSYYRNFERPINMSEDGQYWSAFDNKVHKDNGVSFYNDDWIWDTYRAAHPLRILMDQKIEEDVLASYLRMAEQMGTMWMPTFPEVNGDSRRMNSNHGVAAVADAMVKGLHIDTANLYVACKKGIEEKTLAPWSGRPAGWIDKFYKEHGYIPALKEGEQENDPNVNPHEKRQPVAVTLGTSYDEWCLSRIAKALGKDDDAKHFEQDSYNYRNLYNDSTAFFHPKDKDGNFIEPFDYSFSGGMGAREYYGENNGWVYRWDVPHNIEDLIKLMGGRKQFIANLDQTFAQPLGRSKYEFYAKLPDHTGNVGQFSMANEPSFHIPYLYNYAGAPWKTQKRIRQLLKTWYRNDLMGMPGDEDGSGMTSFVVFSMLGFYPVTPGIPCYNIGSPMFTDAKMTLSNGKTFEIVAHNASDENKYIQSATLNGKPWNKPWITHKDIINGAKLELEMGSHPNKTWGADPQAAPPSADDVK